MTDLNRRPAAQGQVVMVNTEEHRVGVKLDEPIRRWLIDRVGPPDAEAPRVLILPGALPFERVPVGAATSITDEMVAAAAAAIRRTFRGLSGPVYDDAARAALEAVLR